MFFVAVPADEDVGVAEFEAEFFCEAFAEAVVPAADEDVVFLEERFELRGDGDGLDVIVDDDILEGREGFEEAGADFGDAFGEFDAGIFPRPGAVSGLIALAVEVFFADFSLTEDLQGVSPIGAIFDLGVIGRLSHKVYAWVSRAVSREMGVFFIGFRS